MNSVENIHLNSFASLFGEEKNNEPVRGNMDAKTGNEVQEIPLTELVTFHNHTFRVDETSDDFKELTDSIKENGKILNPVLVRPYHGKYEIISGHRRTAAGRAAGLMTIPCIVREFTDDEATVVMVDSNIQRTNLLPSEKAKSYKAKYEALKAIRRTTNKETAEGDPGVVMRSDDILGEDTGESGRTIQRYISLTKLLPSLLDDIDTGLIKPSVGYDIACLDETEQQLLYDYLLDAGRKISVKQGKELKKNAGSLTADKIKQIFYKGEKEPTEIVLKKDNLKQFFPDEFTIEDMEITIYRLLSKYQEERKEDDKD